MAKRLFDIVFSLLGLLIVSPFLLIIALFIKGESKGPVFYIQERIGKGHVAFKLLKFRTMRIGSDKKGLITVGARDSRVTNIGYYLRKYKLDELPQLINVLVGDMSFVGPRPEVRKYVDLYTEEQQKVFEVRPGITDLASLKYINENELLAQSNNPNETYINQIMPEKLQLNLEYIEKQSFLFDLGIIFKTVFRIAGVKANE